jgi:endoglucanase
MWDNGADHFERSTGQWRDQTVLSIMMNAVKGVVNSLPDSSTGSETEQWSSAYVYHKAGAAVTSASLPYLFNGNTLSRITNAKTGKALTKTKDYSVTGSNITLTASYLKTIITSTATGSLANLTLAFNRGASTNLEVLQYATPKLGATTSKVPATSADLLIPVSWAGQKRPAAVKGVRSDGTILFDDWTVYLGPLQQGRMTYGNQWDWDGSNVILKAATLDAVRSGGKTATFTIEFYPREPTNVANYTLTV